MVLSCLLNGIPKQKIAKKIGLSERQVRRELAVYKEKGVLNANEEVVAELPDNYVFPFIYLTEGYVNKLGLNRALYFSYQKSWNHGSISPDKVSRKLLGFSRCSVLRYRQELEKLGAIKEGRLDMVSIENVFNVKRDTHQKHLDKARDKMKRSLKYGDIAWMFNVLCAEHGYSQVMPPLKSDIAKAMSIQKTLEKAGSPITLGQLMERLIMKWNTLWGNKPPMPTLRSLPVYYPNLFDNDEAVVETVLVRTPQGVAPKKHKTEDELIDEYNTRMLGGE